MVLQPPTRPWWQFPRIDNFGLIDPAGPYYKPDTNVQIPGDYPVQDLLSGTVTSVQQGVSWGQDVITIALDTPLNSKATHTFYEHLSQVDVTPGEHVSTGQVIGYNNPSGQVPLGFGFYSGDVYGSGSAWSQLQQDLAPGGPGLLDPAPYLNSLLGGSAPPGSTTTDLTQGGILSSGSSQCPSGGTPLTINGKVYCVNSTSDAQRVGNAITSSLFGWINQEFLIRAGMIAAGAIIVFIGIHKLL